MLGTLCDDNDEQVANNSSKALKLLLRAEELESIMSKSKETTRRIVLFQKVCF